MSTKSPSSETDRPSPDSWSAGWVWLAYTLLFGFMPLSLGLLGLSIGGATGLLKRGVGWADFLVHGELLIYAASLAAASTRLISSDVNVARPFAHRQVFNLMGYAIIVPSAAAYAIIRVLALSGTGAQMDARFMISFSVPMVVASVLFSFLAFVLDHHRTTTPPNLAAEIRKESEELSQDFDKLEEAEANGKLLEPEKPLERSDGDA